MKFLRKVGRGIVSTPRWILITLAVLVVIRMLLPIVGKKAINWALNEKLGEYTGSIEDFDLSLFRGAYQLQGLIIKKRDATLPPILDVKEIDLSLAWASLFRKEISADIIVETAVVRLIDSKDKEQKQVGAGEKGWRDALDVVIPVHIESLIFHESAVYFTNSDFKEAVPVRLESIEFSAQDLRSRKEESKKAFGPVFLRALAQGHAVMAAKGHVDILSDPPRGDFDFQFEKFRLPTVNSNLILYLPLDVTKGNLDIFGEVATANGDVEGYAKVFISDGDVIKPKQQYVSLKHFGIELGSAFANWLLKNSETKNVAAYIPFERKAGKFNVDASEAFWSAVQNIWDELPKGLDNTIDMKSLNEKEKTEVTNGT